MSDFDPGPGWREMEAEERYDGPRRDQLMWTGTGVGDVRYFVREEPLPPLPTEPYTVIRVTWSDEDVTSRDMALHPADRYQDEPFWVMTTGNFYTAEELTAAITGFEVLAEPRAVTAKTVLDRIAELHQSGSGSETLRAVADEFKVASDG